MSKTAPKAAPRKANLLLIETFSQQHFIGAAVELTGDGARVEPEFGRGHMVADIQDELAG